MSKYWVLAEDSDNQRVIIDSIPDSGVANWKFKKGEPLSSEFNENVKVYFSKNFPNGTKLTDFVSNILGLLIVSDKVKQLIEDEGVENVEFLPLIVCDHKKNTVDEKYWIANLLGGQDIIDMKKSKYRIGSIDKTQIKDIDDLIVNYEAVDENVKLFRANEKMNLYIINQSFKDTLEKNNITGYNTFEADGWDGLDF